MKVSSKRSKACFKMLDLKELSVVKSQTIDIVREAGGLVRSYYGQKIDSHSKGGLDFATEADDAVDKFIKDKLSESFSSIKILTEETAPSDYLALNKEELLWVVDPIDGTTNFSRGIEPFCISVGLVSKGRPVLGVIFEPTKNILYHASLNDDYAYQDEKPLKVSSVSDLAEAYLVTGLPWDMEKRKEVYALIDKVYLQVRALGSRGSAAQDLCELSKGSIDGFFITGIKPWDIAAGSLFVLKAGGKISSLSGDPWNVFETDLVFSNNNLHEKVLGLLS